MDPSPAPRAKNKAGEHLTAFVVYALRYADLISEIQEASAYAWPRDGGDIVNALLVGLPDNIGLSLGVRVSQKDLSCRVH